MWFSIIRLSIFLILLSYWSIYDNETMITCLDILKDCFKKLKSLPNNFDFMFFFSGIKKIILFTDHAFGLAKCMQFLYENYALFSSIFIDGDIK